jgi:hypothetical protein
LNFNPKSTDELSIFRLGDLTDVTLELKHPSNEQSGFKNYSSYQPKTVKIIDNLSAKIQVKKNNFHLMLFRFQKERLHLERNSPTTLKSF